MRKSAPPLLCGARVNRARLFIYVSVEIKNFTFSFFTKVNSAVRVS